ncbi:MAG: hypothetical protein LAQ69_32030 [Acidobacteriia bacterium]|nr:hypothetical protein [Terriglobia bacterium]
MQRRADYRDPALPVDEQLEREILGSCFVEDTALLSEVRAVMGDSDFAIEDHRRMFRSLCRLADSGEPLTWTAVYGDMQARHEPITLAALADFSSAAWALDRMLRKAKDLARRRELIFRSRDIMHQAAGLTLPLNELT